jgi:hypothetical protein
MGRPRTVVDWGPAPVPDALERAIANRQSAEATLYDALRADLVDLRARIAALEAAAAERPLDGWATVAEASTRTRWSCQAIQGWARQGLIRTMQSPGGHWRVYLPDIEALGRKRRPKAVVLAARGARTEAR